MVGNLGGGDGDSFTFSQPDLEFVTRTIGGETRLFSVNLADTLNGENVRDFPSIIAGVGDPLAVPVGESYIGFPVKEPVDNVPFFIIGWAKLLRTDDGSLEVLANAAEYGATEVSPSKGIVVGVPEPSGAGVLLPLIAVGCLLRRGRQGCAKR